MDKIDERIVKQYARHVAWNKTWPKPCEICGNAKAHAHHDDYNKPAEVRYLCQKHHAEWHAQYKTPPITEEALFEAVRHSNPNSRGPARRLPRPYAGSLQEAYDKGELQITIRLS